jgi:hypothetical protein
MIQKPEDRLSEWFRAAPLPDEPGSLHEFLAAVPRNHARPMLGSPSLTSLWPRRALAGLAAVLLVAIVGGGLLFGLSRGQTVPGGSPSAIATVTAGASGSEPAPTGSAGPTTSAPSSTPTDAASPTPNTAWKAGLPTLTLPATAIKTVGVSLPAPDSVSTQVWGSRYYLADWKTVIAPPEEPLLGADAILRYGDASNGKAASVPLPLTAAELAGMTNPDVGGGFSVAADGSHVAVVVWYRLAAISGPGAIPCASNAGSPIAWRILVAPIDPSTGAPGAFAAHAGGRSQIAFRPMGGEGCDTVAAPLVALSGDQIAYNIEAATGSHPLAGTILLHSLAGGTPNRQIQTTAMPIGLRVSGTNVAWLESDGNEAVPLRLSTAAHPAPGLVDTIETLGAGGTWPIPRFAFDGDRLAWENGNNEVMTETLNAGTTRISPAGVACILGGFEAGKVLLTCYPSDPFMGGGNLALWSSGAGLQLVAGIEASGVANGVSWLSNSWVATEGGGYPSSGVTFFRLSDLAG